MDETVVSPPPGDMGPKADVVDLDEKILAEAVRRGFITPVQGRGALEEARARGVPLLEVLVGKGLVEGSLAKDLDEETREDFVPGYRVLSKLGEGGMGVVYKALQKRLDREVALKVVTPGLASDANYLRRFEREAKAVAKLNHPCIVAAYDYGESRGRVFFAMEFVDGINCADEVRAKGPMEEARALAIVRDVASGLAHAHAAGIIHRDIKPANILLAARGAGHTASGTAAGAKVTDLGLARSGDGPGASDLTAAGTILGTPGYMAPEQAFGGEVDHRSDIYALGATLYQFITGIRPFEASTPVAVIARQQSDRLSDPREVVGGISPGIVALLHGMMARDPSSRYPTYRDLLDDIDRVRQGALPILPLPPAGHRSIADPDDSALQSAAGAGTLVLPPGGATASRSGAKVASAPPMAAPAARRSGGMLVVGAVVAIGAIAAFFALSGGGDSPPDEGGAPTSPGGGDAVPPSEVDEAKRIDEKIGEALAAGESGDALALLVEAVRMQRRAPEAVRAATAARIALVETALDGYRVRESESVADLWKEGKYDEGLARVRSVRDAMGDLAGPALDGLFQTLGSIGLKGAEERNAIQEARTAVAKGDPLRVLTFLEDFESRYPFSPDLAEAGRLRARAEEDAPVVRIDSRPTPSRVLLDGKDRGMTPFRERLPTGKVTLVLEAAGFKPLQRTVDVEARTGFDQTFDLDPLPPPDPVPSVVLVTDGNPLPLWTGNNVGSWSTKGGSWSTSDPSREVILDGAKGNEPAALLRGQSASTLARTERDVTRMVTGAPGWRLELAMVGAGRSALETSRVEVHFGLARDERALVIGIDDQGAYLGRRDPSTGALERTHEQKGVAANRNHTFVVENHGGVYRGYVDKKPLGALAAPADAAEGVVLRLAVESGVGFFSDITLQQMAAPK